MTNTTNPPSKVTVKPAPPPAEKSQATIALGWLHTAQFLTTAPQLHFLPALDVPEIAFVGRSNAGKSTCINTLTQQKQLAFASKKPGRTQHINLFSLGQTGRNRCGLDRFARLRLRRSAQAGQDPLATGDGQLFGDAREPESASC